MSEKRLMPLRVPFKKLDVRGVNAEKVQKNAPVVKRVVLGKQNALVKSTNENLPQQENIDFLGKTTPQTVSHHILSTTLMKRTATWRASWTSSTSPTTACRTFCRTRSSSSRSTRARSTSTTSPRRT